MSAEIIARLSRLFDSSIAKRTQWGADNLLLSAHVATQRGVSIFAGKIDSVEIADEIKIGVWLKVKDRWGASTLEQISEDSLERAVKQAVQAAAFSDPDPDYALATPAETREPFKPDEAIVSFTMGDLEKIALQMESRAKQFSPAIKNIPRAGCGYSTHARIVANSSGVSFVEQNYFLRSGLSVMAAGADGRMVNYYDVQHVIDRDDFDPDRVVDEVAAEAVRRIEPRALPSGEIAVLFDPATAAQMLSTFAAVFSGDMLYRKLTRLDGKLDQSIAADLVTIRQVGQGGLVPHNYDAEGVLCQNKNIVEQGTFKTFLHNLYTAKKTGMQTTGNAAGGIGEAPGVAPTNLSWECSSTASEQSEADLRRQMGTGLLVTELHGASASPISGDFSYGALGHWIEAGKIQHAVADVTIAGNFFKLLKDIQSIGNDLRWFSPSLMGSIGGRSLLVSNLALSGT